MAREIIYDKCFVGNFKLLGFATGAYFCKCSDCGKQFVGDKLSFQCLGCAIKLVESKLQSANAEQQTKVPICPNCKGTGRAWSDTFKASGTCIKCDGSGKQ